MINFIKDRIEKGSGEHDLDKIKTPVGRYDLIDSLTAEYTQRKVSKMDSDIISVTGFSASLGRHLAQRACKVWCLWLELYTKNLCEMNFAQFFEYGYNNGFIDINNCSLLKTQEKILELLKNTGLIKSSIMVEVNNLQIFKQYNLSSNWSGTIRIETEKDKFHSIPSYNLNGSIKISDLSYRGRRVDPWKYVTPENFRYFTEIREG